MSVPPMEVVGDGPFAGLPADDIMKILLETYLLFPLRQLRACGEDANWGIDIEDGVPTGAAWIEGEDVPFGLVQAIPRDTGIQLLGCVFGMDKWDAMKARGLR